MKRFSIPLTLSASITVDAVGKAQAISEAARFAESCGPESGFVDGWNSAYPPSEELRIVDFNGLVVDAIDEGEVEEIGADDDAVDYLNPPHRKPRKAAEVPAYLLEAARDMLDAFGGDTPHWLRPQAEKLALAVEQAEQESGQA